MAGLGYTYADAGTTDPPIISVLPEADTRLLLCLPPPVTVTAKVVRGCCVIGFFANSCIACAMGYIGFTVPNAVSPKGASK